jgi:broad specificity phosphatase PhoE
VSDEFRPRFNALDDDMDGGESLRSISERISEATREIVAQHMGETVMVVGHSGVNPLVIAELIGLPPERAISEIRQGNDEVYKLTVSPEGAVTMWKLIPEDRLEEL